MFGLWFVKSDMTCWHNTSYQCKIFFRSVWYCFTWYRILTKDSLIDSKPTNVIGILLSQSHASWESNFEPLIVKSLVLSCHGTFMWYVIFSKISILHMLFQFTKKYPVNLDDLYTQKTHISFYHVLQFLTNFVFISYSHVCDHLRYQNLSYLKLM